MTQGKIIMLGYDEIIAAPANTASCSYCLRANEVEALLALLEYQNWATRWFSTSRSPVDQDAIDAFTDGIRATLMAECQNDIVLTRIDGDGNWQISTDGGTTWTDAPGQDPRLATPVAPPASGADGDDKRCAAANSITTYFKQLAQNIHDAKDRSANLSDFTAVIVGLLLVLGLISGGWLFAALGALIALLWANTDLATWDAAINDDMWQKFICAIYPFINADASVTDYLGLAAAVQAELDDTVARATWDLYLKLMGDNGLTNAARAMYGGNLSCTCGDCVAEKWLDYDAWAALSDYSITYNEDGTIDVHGGAYSPYWYVGMYQETAQCCHIQATITWDSTVGAFLAQCWDCNDTDPPNWGHEDDPGWVTQGLGIDNVACSAFQFRANQPYTLHIEISS